jgi:DNA primase
MGKTYIDTVKYLVYANIEIGGLVEKPDVVGAIFGQTEGLLGDELDLRDLQKNGRIGRIEVELSGREGRSSGIVKIPSSLDMVETCIIAAALETVDRVGPCEASIRITKVEDTRNAKRKVLLDRAKGLLKTLLNTEIPESKEISDLVREEVKTAEITEYGEDKLPAGPGIDRVKEIIVVEGRADVINLLKNDITNVVAVQGAKVPNTIIHLSKGKEVTVFLDGDRGGDIILNELVQCGVDIDFVARAPPGKEVEELMRKELIKCLRSRVPFEQSEQQRKDERSGARRRFPERQERRFDEPRREERTERPVIVQERERVFAAEPQQPQQPSQPVSGLSVPPRKAEKSELSKELDELNNTLRARFFNASLERIAEMPVRDVIKALEETQGVDSIVFDGIITQRLVDLASNKGVKTLIGVKIGNVNKTPPDLEIITKNR